MKNKIIEIAHVLNSSTGLSIQAIDKEGNIIYEYGDAFRFCKMFKDCTKESCTCSNSHLYSSKLAVSFGDTYIFFCPAKLTLITCPIVINNQFEGALLAGPLLMTYPDKLLVDEIIQDNNLDISSTGKIISYLNSIPVVEASKVTSLSKLIFFVCNNLMTENHQLNEQKEKMIQQSKINENIQMFKYSDEPKDNYPYEKEKELFTKVKNGNISESKAILNELLGYIFFKSGSNGEIIKARALELCSVLSRAAVDGGAELETIFGLNDKYIHKIITSKNVDDLSFAVQNVLDGFTENVLNISSSKDTVILKKAIKYINDNYEKHVTLDDVANHVHLSPTYFSTLFKQGTNSSISDYINSIRIEESKQLLLNSNFSILDIAIAVGFADQSYYTKVFKKITNITPKQFRKKNI